MKNVKSKIISLALVCALATPIATTLVGCGNGNKDGKTIEISTFNAGYGSQWLHELVKGYTALHPEVTIEVDDTYYGNDKVFLSQLESGATTTDIYFARDPMFTYMARGQLAGDAYYDCLLEDMTEWYSGSNPYDDVAVKDKLDQNLFEQISYSRDGGAVKQYTVPFVTSILGLLYNTEIMEGYTLPNTTDELIALCVALKNNGITPFVNSLSNDFFGTLQEQWLLQYEGYETMMKIFDGYAADGSRYTPEIFATEGILKKYEVLYELMCPENGFVHKDSKDLTFTAAQNYILDSSYKVAMVADGDWIQREMESNYSPEEIKIEFMRLPIISAIVEKLEYRDNGKYMSDEMLSNVVAAIDEGKTTYEGVSQNDMNRLIEARGHITGYSEGHIAYIPVYSDQKDIAKDFLYYMVSDDGLRCITRGTKGSTSPYDFDYLDDAETSKYMNDFAKNTYKLYKSSKYSPYEYSKNPLFSLGSVALNYTWTGVSLVQAFMSEVGEKTHYTAEEYFTYRYNHWSDQWQKILTAAGVTAVYA